MTARIGFHFIPFPQEIVDQGLKLSLGEYRLLGYLLRHRIRLQQSTMTITQNELLQGREREDGSRFDVGSGLTSARDLKAAREALVGRGWLRCADTPTGMVYELLLEGDEVKVQNAPLQNDNLSVSTDVERCNMHSEDSTNQVQNAPAYIKELEVNTLEELFPMTDKTSSGVTVTSASAIKGPDSRRSDFKEIIFRFYRWKWKRDPGWDGGDAAQLSRVLKANPHLEPKTFAQWLLNYSRSKDITPGERPRRFLPRIENYSVSPLNQFGRDGSAANQNGKASPAQERTKRILDRHQRYAATQGIAVEPVNQLTDRNSEGTE